MEGHQKEWLDVYDEIDEMLPQSAGALRYWAAIFSIVTGLISVYFIVAIRIPIKRTFYEQGKYQQVIEQVTLLDLMQQ